MTEYDDAVKQMIINDLKPVLTLNGDNITLTMDFNDSEKVTERRENEERQTEVLADPIRG